ncbi:hypothetical protein CR513_61297, partial [Mucuna pruriens]
MFNYNTTPTPVEANIKLVKGEAKESIDNTNQATRLDISFNIGLDGRFAENPKQSHLILDYDWYGDKKQIVVALSCEVEYIVTCNATCLAGRYATRIEECYAIVDGQ